MLRGISTPGKSNRRDVGCTEPARAVYTGRNIRAAAIVRST
jgi:hypothetical protein